MVDIIFIINHHLFSENITNMERNYHNIPHKNLGHEKFMRVQELQGDLIRMITVSPIFLHFSKCFVPLLLVYDVTLNKFCVFQHGCIFVRVCRLLPNSRLPVIKVLQKQIVDSTSINIKHTVVVLYAINWCVKDIL